MKAEWITTIVKEDFDGNTTFEADYIKASEDAIKKFIFDEATKDSEEEDYDGPEDVDDVDFWMGEFITETEYYDAHKLFSGRKAMKEILSKDGNDWLFVEVGWEDGGLSSDSKILVGTEDEVKEYIISKVLSLKSEVPAYEKGTEKVSDLTYDASKHMYSGSIMYDETNLDFYVYPLPAIKEI